MGVAGVAGQHHAGKACGHFGFGHIVELVGQAVPDLVDRPPDHLFHIQLERAEDALCLGNDVVGVHAAVGRALVFAQVVELHIQAHQMAAFARQHHQDAVALRAHERLHAPVGEIGRGEQVDHAPGLVRRVALQLAADGAAHIGARAVAADHVVGAHRVRLALAAGRGALQRHRDRVLRCPRVHRQVGHFPAVVGHEATGRLAHDVEEHVVHPRLVDQDMGHLGNALGHVLHPRHAVQPDVGIGSRRPEGGLVDPDRLARHLLAKAEGLKHLHRAHIDAICLALLHAAQLGFHQHGADLRHPRQLRRQAQAGRPRARDQDVHRLRQRIARLAVAWRCRAQVRVVGNEAVLVVLHGVSPSSVEWRQFCLVCI